MILKLKSRVQNVCVYLLYYSALQEIEEWLWFQNVMLEIIAD